MASFQIIHQPRKSLDIYSDDVIERYLAGESENSIAKSFSISRPKIRRLLRRGDVLIRDSLAANRLMMSKRTPEENRKNVQQAHMAVRGSVRTLSAGCKQAITRQHRGGFDSVDEQTFFESLQVRNMFPIPQQAIGPYNCDIGLHPIAVEIFGGGWHWYGKHLARLPERLNFLMDAGWTVIMIVVQKRRQPLTTAATNHVVEQFKIFSSDPTRTPEYQVVGGTGNLIARGSIQNNNIATVHSFACARNTREQYYSVPR
jgi:hypothetical protein